VRGAERSAEFRERPRGAALRGHPSVLRIAVGGIAHETNTFSSVPTTLDRFQERSYLSGEAILRRSRGTRNVLGGLVDEAEARGVRLLPTLVASALPAGVVERTAWAVLRERLLGRLRAYSAGPWSLDGVILLLHGAMVAEGDDDPEGTLLTDVRSLVGPAVPVVAVLDSHANLTPAMAGAADLLLGYRTYPHVDVVERGREAVDRLLQLRDRGIRPATALRVLPLLAPLPPQRTDGPTAMHEVLERAREIERDPRVLAAEVAGGFPYADVPFAGASVRVATDGDPTLAEALADRLAASLWDRRDRFRVRGASADEAIDRALTVPGGRGPVVLADVADNPGAGAAGDGTLLLERLLERGVSDAVVAALPSPAAVAAALAAGEGGTVRVVLGEQSGQPLPITARVRRLSDGVFVATGPMATGGPTRLGRTALLAVDGVEVVVCERPIAANDPALFRTVGIDPAARRLLVLKSGVHFRAAFFGMAAEIVEVETAGLSPSDLSTLPYRRVRRPVAPLDPVVRYLD
jgi:microcystin degradation protein MlrC